MSHSTHEVLNQPQPLVGYNLFSGNRALQDAESRLAGNWGHAFGMLPEDTDFDAIIERAVPR